LLTSLGCLNTMDKLHTYQIITLLICILCGFHVETHDHMFFEWPFSTLVWGTLMNRTLIGWPTMTWWSFHSSEYPCISERRKISYICLLG
jgi:hypothetical protein